MNTDNIWSFLFVGALLVYALTRRLRRTKRVYIPDYKRGVRFVKGSFANILGPGSYRPFSRKDQIEVVDMRPQPVILEKISFRDALQNESIVSVGAEILVCDAYLATTMLKEQINDSLPIVRDTLRTVVSRGIADGSLEFRGKMAADMTQAVNVELGRFGMKISDVEIIELWSRPRIGRITTVSN